MRCLKIAELKATLYFLRRHYPDQVKGFDLSPLYSGTPFFDRVKGNIF